MHMNCARRSAYVVIDHHGVCRTPCAHHQEHSTVRKCARGVDINLDSGVTRFAGEDMVRRRLLQVDECSRVDDPFHGDQPCP